MATKNVRANLFSSVKDWYVKQYPTDTMGNDIDENVLFVDVAQCLAHKKDFYECVKAYDSIVRERIFEKLAKILKVDYDKVYYMWVGTPTGYIKL